MPPVVDRPTLTAKPESGKPRRHEKASAAFVEARCILKNAGREAERVVESICIHDQVPAGFAELEALRVGLSALSHWLTQVRRKAR